ncbi:hypothetical protein [Nocardioides sp. AE5]|uniref:hypothetical protein n=1 Tax=Nocardioides sp. AE5 TaxID=2962573 RepID=UPI00288149BA|nr:hypothetical protein [Nocardioides sp. AE5]MDT0201948.1 hypothetical protein [Nocardioides sp. AE5]
MATLTDKYVHAVTRSLPEDQRTDLAHELRATVADRIDSLLESGLAEDREAAEYAAIVELDDPVRMAAGYTGKPLHLIGPAVFPAYVRLLRTLGFAVLPVIAAVTVVVGIFADRSVGGIIGAATWATFNVAVHMFFWVTLIWVLVERKSAPAEAADNLAISWSPDDLPDPPRETDFMTSETVLGIAFLGATIAFLIGQHFLSWFDDPAGDAIPMLDPGLWSGWLPALIAVLVAMAALEVVKFRTGRWTPALTLGNGVLEVAFAAPVIWLAATDRLVNPAFLAELDPGWADETHHNLVIIMVVAAVALWGIVDSVRKTRRPDPAMA